MKRGMKAKLTIGLPAAMLAAGCATQPESVEIRAVGTRSASLQSGAAGLAEAGAMLRLGNAGLALEAFRKVHRETPSSESLAGIAACYVAMGRDDLAKTNYEAALALAPSNPTYLVAVSQVMDRLGLRAEAAMARAQARALAPVVAPAAQGVAVELAAKPAAVSVPPPLRTAEFRPTRAADKSALLLGPRAEPSQAAPRAIAKPVSPPVVGPKVAIAKPSPLVDPAPSRFVMRPSQVAMTSVQMAPTLGVGNFSMPAEVALPQPEPEPVAAAPEPAEPQAAPVNPEPVAMAVAEARKLVEDQQLGASITVKLPVARPAKAKPKEAVLATFGNPRLERLSPGVVALVTTPAPLWAARTVAQTRISTTVRWVPVRHASVTPNIRLLNAARVEGVAAAARNVLTDRGWRKIEIGDHAEIRLRSIVLYPPERRRLAKSLAAQFGIEAREAKGGPLTVLLGRDMRGRIRG